MLMFTSISLAFSFCNVCNAILLLHMGFKKRFDHLRENNETVNRQQKRGYVPPFFVAYLLLARDSRFLVNTVHQICSDNFFHLRPYYFPYMFGYTI